jgi:hypothetical protein
MPGLRALTHGVEGTTRARIAAWYTSSFTIGAAPSFLFGRVGTLLGWRSAFFIAGILGVAGILIAWVALPQGDSGHGEQEPQPPLDFRPVRGNPDVRVLIVGYAAAIWGCVRLRQWIVVFLTFCAGGKAADLARAWIILAVGAVINFLGVPAGLIGNELSIHYGLRTIATLVFALSAFAGGLFGFTVALPHVAVLGLSVVAGFIVQGNFSNLTSGVLAVAARHYLGATIGLYSCIGFGASFLGTAVRRHPRPVRRDVAAGRLGGELRHLWTCLLGGCGGDRFPAPERLAGVIAPAGPEQDSGPLEGYAKACTLATPTRGYPPPLGKRPTDPALLASRVGSVPSDRIISVTPEEIIDGKIGRLDRRSRGGRSRPGVDRCIAL